MLFSVLSLENCTSNLFCWPNKKICKDMMSRVAEVQLLKFFSLYFFLS